MLLGEVSFTNLEQFLDHLVPKVQNCYSNEDKCCKIVKYQQGHGFLPNMWNNDVWKFKLGIIIHYPHLPSNQKGLSNSSFPHNSFNLQVTGTGAATA